VRSVLQAAYCTGTHVRVAAAAAARKRISFWQRTGQAKAERSFRGNHVQMRASRCCTAANCSVHSLHAEASVQ
jgi:hypothetical protein